MKHYRVNLSLTNPAVRLPFWVTATCFRDVIPALSPESRLALSPTSVGVVEVDELLPFVVREEAEDSTPEGRSHLDDKLHLIIGGVTGSDKGGVQSAAERGQGVHGLLVVESEDGVHPAGELRANCRDSKVHEGHELKKKHDHSPQEHFILDTWPLNNIQSRVRMTLKEAQRTW